eukprot:274017-Chlamydomonas_euryale.AAC.2
MVWVTRESVQADRMSARRVALRMWPRRMCGFFAYVATAYKMQGYYTYATDLHNPTCKTSPHRAVAQ